MKKVGMLRKTLNISPNKHNDKFVNKAAPYNQSNIATTRENEQNTKAGQRSTLHTDHCTVT